VDLVARVLAQAFSEQLHQKFVVQNRGGAGGTLATDEVAKAEPNGYTLLLCANGEITLAPFVQGKLPYDPLRDLAPIILIASSPQVIAVNSSVPASNMSELIAYARAKNEIGYGTPGAGSAAHIGFESVRNEANLPFFHVPYKGGAPAVADLGAGHIQMAVVTISALASALESRRVRPIAVLQPERSALLPNVPTFKESSRIDARDASSWFALMAPSGTPHDILTKLEIASMAALTPEVRARFGKAKLDIIALSSEPFRARLFAESAANEKAVARIGIAPK
jgi:tripartite-type tricarboxylate transporter receptor subunit TctC